LTIDSLLQPFEHFGVCLGLDNIRRLLSHLGNPQEQVPIVHVAGSNGKGSVCAYLSSVLTQAGYRVGRYTSPHLVNWNERICLNDHPISTLDLEQTLQQVIAAIRADEPSPTQFEVITAAAWLYFAQQKVDIAVIEVGLGGRLDATNVCDRPLVSIITSLSREHWQRLGPTLADIAGEKAGILKPQCPAVVGPLPPDAAIVVKNRIAELQCPIVWAEPAKWVDPPASPLTPDSLPWAEFRGVRYPLALQGEIQLTNSAMAIAALQILQQQGWQIPYDAIVQGMAKTRWQGRLQWITWQGHKLLIDGAHNPASAEVLRQFVDRQIEPLSQKPKSIHWIMGMLSTKDHADVFKALLRSGDSLSLVPVPDHSSADPIALAKLARELCPGLIQCQTYPALLPALDTAIVKQTSDSSFLVLCGSLYLLGHFFRTAAV
jgi:dihydrofolate synthase/folylpolyglutamate synthase